MAAPVGTGMDKADMKRLLAKSKTDPVNAAMGLGADQGTALLLMDKIKQPKALEKDLTKAFPDAKNTRFGTAFVDVDLDPKLARFRINRAASGLARKLLKTLKGTGFSKVEIVLDDDTLVDSATSEEEEGAGQARPQAQPEAPALDAAELTRRLAGLIPKVGPAAGADAGRKTQLVTLATQAQGGLKAGKLEEAAAAIDQLEQALAGGGAAPGSAAPGSAPSDAPPPGTVMFAKSRLAWLAARKKMEGDIDKLRSEILAAYPDEASNLAKLYQDRVAPVLATLDESLADQLDAVVNATDPGQRGTLVTQARATIKQYEDYVAGTQLIADLDDNPFVPLAIRQVVTATLGAISKTVQ